MKQITIFLLLFFSTSFYAQKSFVSYESALQLAQEENKPIMLVFSGSDWCKPCIELKKNILDTQEFLQLKGKMVFLYLDFPFKKANRLARAETKRNEALAEKYNAQGQFPKVLLIDSKGNVISELQYEKGLDKADFIDRIKKNL